MIESNKLKLGLFLVCSFVVLCSLFVVYGLFDYGTRKVPVMTLVKESVQGLEGGSLVKYRGVPIGKVTDITISLDGKLIRIDMEVNLGKVREEPVGGAKPKAVSSSEFYKMMDREIKNGLRARLELNGISGFKYVELDYTVSRESEFKYYAQPGLDPDGIYCIPSEPSMLAGLRANVTEIVAKIASIDYKKISERVETVLASSEKLINDPYLKKMLRNSEELSAGLNRSVQSLNKTFTGERMDFIAEETANTLHMLKQIAAKLETAIDKSMIPETTESFRKAADTLSNSRKSIDNTASKINETMDALIELMKLLDDRPGAILHGK